MQGECAEGVFTIWIGGKRPTQPASPLRVDPEAPEAWEKSKV